MGTTSFWQLHAQQPRREVDFLIVGAGIVGGAAAIFATQAGRDVLVVDQAAVGLGASGRNAGFMITGLDTYYHKAIATYGADVAAEMWQLSRETIAFWKQVVANSAGAVPYEACGSLLLAETAAEKQDLQLAARALAAAGIEALYHDHDPLGRGYFAAIEQPLDGAVQPYALAQALLTQSGADYMPNNRVYHLEQARADCVTVYTQQVVIEARYVLLCVNAYAPLLHDYFVGKVMPTRAQCLVTEPLPERPLPTCGYSDYGYMYYRSTFDNRLLLGGARNRHTALEQDTTEDRLCWPVQRALDAYRERYFPDVTVPVAQRWSGIMGFSVDGLPLVGTLPQAARVGFAVGFTGHGLAMGAGAAERAVAHLLYGTAPGAVAASRLH